MIVTDCRLIAKPGTLVFCKAYAWTLAETKALPNPWLASLTEVERKNLETYQELFGMNVAVNLNQNATERPFYSKTDSNGFETLFTLIHNCGVVWFNPLNRVLCPKELALSQGFEVLRSDRLTTCFSHQMQRSRTAYAGQVGNSMNTCVIGSFLQLCLILSSDVF